MNEFDVIFTYTRQEAIADGEQTCISELYPDDCRVFKYPVYLTRDILLNRFAAIFVTIYHSTILKIMAQLTIYKPDNSIADVLIISECLYKELSRVARLFELEYLNLAFIREIKRRVLLTVTTVESLDENTLNWVTDRELKESLLGASHFGKNRKLYSRVILANNDRL